MPQQHTHTHCVHLGVVIILIHVSLHSQQFHLTDWSVDNAGYVQQRSVSGLSNATTSGVDCSILSWLQTISGTVTQYN